MPDLPEARAQEFIDRFLGASKSDGRDCLTKQPSWRLRPIDTASRS